MSMPSRTAPVVRGDERHRQSGWVTFPEHLQSSGEGGMWVLAVVDGDSAHNNFEYQGRDERPFERCHMDTLPQLTHPNVMVDPDPTAGDPVISCSHCDTESRWDYEAGAPMNVCPACGADVSDDAMRQKFPLEERHWPRRDEYFKRGEDHDPLAVLSHEFLACVCLGASNGTWLTHEYGYWNCGREDLTPEGLALVESLEALYSRPVRLLTFVDT